MSKIFFPVLGAGGGETAGITTATDPAVDAAVTTPIIDVYAGTVITTTTTGNDQTLAAPSITTPGKQFVVSLSVDSTDLILVGGVAIQIGDLAFFIWDGAAWVSDVTRNSILSSQATGWVTGCVVSINADPTKYDVSAGVVCVLDAFTDVVKPEFNLIPFAGVTGVTPIAILSLPFTSILIDKNGAIVEMNTPPTPSNYRDLVRVGSVVHPATTILSVENSITCPITSLASTIQDLATAVGSINVSGNVISPDGANLSIDVSAGTEFTVGINAKGDNKNPNNVSGPAVDAFAFFPTYRDGGGGFIIGAGTNVFVPGFYDDGTGGNAVNPNGTYGNNEYAIHRVYLALPGATRGVQYGQNVYSTIAGAELAINSETFIKNPVFDGFLFRAWVILKGNATDMSDPLQAKFISAGKFGGLE